MSRRALCIGVGSFTPVSTSDGDEQELTPFEVLDYAAEYTAELHAALRATGYDADLVVNPIALGEKQLGERVERHFSGGGVAVVHVLSHGDHIPDGGVYVVGSDAARSKRTRVEDWRIAVVDDPSAPMTLFLLDLCHAGAANRHWQPPVSGVQERAWVIAATGADQPAYAGRFTRAATTVINGITSGELDLAPTVRVVGFDVLFERIRKEVRALALAEGGRPFGFADDRVTVVDTEAAVIRECAARVLSGESLASICRDLAERRITTSGGKRWLPTTIRQLLVSARISGRREHIPRQGCIKVS